MTSCRHVIRKTARTTNATVAPHKQFRSIKYREEKKTKKKIETELFLEQGRVHMKGWTVLAFKKRTITIKDRHQRTIWVKKKKKTDAEG